MLQVNTNLPAMTANRTLSATSRNLNTTVERLSTGLRINRASDDPAGLVISEKLRMQINGLSQALENTQNDINLINTAEAALQEISDILVDMRASVIFAMNTGFSIPEQIDAEQDSIDQSLVAIDRIAQSTRFAKRNLLNGEADFIIEQSTNDAAALDELQVRQVRLAPSAATQTFSVAVTQLAGRGTLVTNKSFGGDDLLASMSAGGSAADFVTLRVSGGKGSEDLNFGASSTLQDLVNAINQNATSTGVYASTFQALPIDSTVHEMVLKGFGGTIDLGGTALNAGAAGGAAIALGVRLDGGAVQNVRIDSGANGIISTAEIQAALTTVDPGFLVDTDANGDIRIELAGKTFDITGASNVRQVTFTAAELAALTDTNADSTIDFSLDIDGDGADDFAGATVPLATAGISFSVEAGDEGELLNSLIATFAPTGPAATITDLAFHFTDSGDLVITDLNGVFQGAGTATPLLAAANGDTGSPAARTISNISNDTAGLARLGITQPSLASSNRPVYYANLDIAASNIDANGDLAIDASGMAAAGVIVIGIANPDAAASAVTDVTFTGTGALVNGSNVVTLADINLGLAALTNYEAFFTKENGLTFVYNNNQSGAGVTSGLFSLVDDTGAGGDISAFLPNGTSSMTSTENTERLALYSLDFGGGEVIKFEDVTSPTSTVRIKSGANGGVMVTADGRDGIGALDGGAVTLSDLAESSFSSAGTNIEGTINGLSFAGSGLNVQLVTTALDLKMSVSERFATFGSAGRQADAVAFGFKSDVTQVSYLKPAFAQTAMPQGVLDSFQFTVRQNFDGGARGISGLRFQIRETNSAQDSLNLGIRSMVSGSLGMDRSPESSAADAASRVNDFNGGKLNTLRSGAGNDLFQNPENALEILDTAVDQVSDLRAFLGSISRDTLERNLNSASIALENLISSESTIRDIDFAKETTELARQQVLFASGTAVLAAANNTPATLLQLLQ